MGKRNSGFYQLLQGRRRARDRKARQSQRDLAPEAFQILSVQSTWDVLGFHVLNPNAWLFGYSKLKSWKARQGEILKDWGQSRHTVMAFWNHWSGVSAEPAF